MAKVRDLIAPVAELLAEVARSRSTITYGEVAMTVGVFHRVIPKVLIEIRSLCLDRGWPPLTVLVVKRSTRRPGDGFMDPWVARSARAAQREALNDEFMEKVWDFDWSSLLQMVKDSFPAYRPTGHRLMGRIELHPVHGVVINIDGRVQTMSDVQQTLSRFEGCYLELRFHAENEIEPGM